MTDGTDFHRFNQEVITRFRESGGVGEIGPVHLDRLILLTTTGRRSGRAHTSPLGSARDDDGNYLLFASNMGAPQDPDWVRNIAADPHVTAEVTGAMWHTEAEILTGAERDDAYRRWLAVAPSTADHEARAGRTIPMVRVPKA